MSDEQIRNIARQGMQKRPHLIRIMRMRNRVVFGGMIVAAILLHQLTAFSIGAILMMVSGATFPLLICWNLVWVNTVIYRITLPESEPHPAENPPA